MSKNRGLGRGLGSLFANTQEEYETQLEQARDDLSSDTLATITGVSQTKSGGNNKAKSKAGTGAGANNLASHSNTASGTTPLASAHQNVSRETLAGGTNNTSGVQQISLSLIRANKNQPRKTFNDERLEELASSIKTHGVIQPILVQKKGAGFEIIAGERRFRAAQLTELDYIPVIVQNLEAQSAKEVALIENLQREDLNAIDSALAIQSLMQEFSLTQETIAKRIGKSRPAVANLLRLLGLPKFVMQSVRDGTLSAGHARSLASISDSQAQVRLAKKAIEGEWSVRALEQAVKNYLEPKPKTKDTLKPPKSKELANLVNNLKRTLSTKVYALGTENKGKIIIEYYSTDDLERIEQFMTGK
ncbi:MAG: ParB/RepB/Spo0J family partition protein [Firmicutes bacterium]|nr:ParB/RepB/Spo0J family partition protein [Bacillota bacterium]